MRGIRRRNDAATFDRARAVSDFIAQDWTTAYGTVGWAHPLKASSPPVRWLLADEMYSQSWDHMHEMYAALVVVEAASRIPTFQARSGPRAYL